MDHKDTKDNSQPREGLTWIPLGCGFTEEEKAELKKEFGSNWRDLFNGL